jgi:hypothetical protein
LDVLDPRFVYTPPFVDIGKLTSIVYNCGRDFGVCYGSIEVGPIFGKFGKLDRKEMGGYLPLKSRDTFKLCPSAVSI